VALVSAHTLLVTLLSARETHGAGAATVGRVLGGVAATAAGATALVLSAGRGSAETALALACVALYGHAMGRAGVPALRCGDPARLQRLVATGVLANMPLQAALLAARGRPATAVVLLLGWPAARRAGRGMAVT
jgi:hypothetical protein